MKTNRNALCPCGSGKKFKRCCIDKQPRYTALTVDLGKKTNVSKVYLDPKKGLRMFDLFGQEIIPSSARLETFYKGDYKERVLSRSDISPNNLLVDPNLFYQEFNRIFAIDTNDRVFQGIKISMASVILAKPIKTQVYANKIGFHTAHTQCFEFHNIASKPENQAWRFLIEGLVKHSEIEQEKIGIIVDSDLGNVKQINERKLPLADDFFLPKQFSLIYGREKREENLANLLIKACHIQSSLLIEELMKNYSEEDLNRVENKPYSHFRVWNIDE